jgi:hypothetical protein
MKANIFHKVILFKQMELLVIKINIQSDNL